MAQSKPDDVLKVNTETHNFGKIKQGTPVTYYFELTNKSDKPLHDLVLYRSSSQGQWSTAHADAVVPAPRPGVPATLPAEPEPMKFTPAGDDPSRFLADDWTARLKSFQLQTADIDLILATLKIYALDQSQTTAVYRLDESVLDNLLPLKITPPPAHVRRIALVIARNIDPNVPRILDRLISQLGDPDWHKRDSASTTLARFGPVAAPRLRQALSNHDLEIVLRAERLLARIAAR